MRARTGIVKKKASRERAGVRRELDALHRLARALGVHTRYVDGLGRQVTVGPETLIRVCAAVGGEITKAADATEAMRRHRALQKEIVVPPVLVAWDGKLSSIELPKSSSRSASLRLADGATIRLERSSHGLRVDATLPPGYHRLTIEDAGREHASTVISTPTKTWRWQGSHRSWGVGAHLAACRSSRSRSVADLRDLETLCTWVRDLGGDLVTLLPLLPTFNGPPPEPSPYSPVSRLFWSELVLDLGSAHRPTGPRDQLDVSAADAEVRAALRDDRTQHPVDDELRRYAQFRGAQETMGRNWRAWPQAARNGTLTPGQIAPDEERFHVAAQLLARQQLSHIRQRLDREGFRLGLDLAVGVHPDGYDPWSRQLLFVDGMSVGAPPDQGFPSGQDWGFSPVLPDASRREGHQYVARSIAHQAELAGVLRIDHIMAWTRLYWIPHGFGLDQGTYVTYPSEELFAVLSLESHTHRCEIVGENLGTVPREIGLALKRHGIRGMYLAQFAAASGTGTRLRAPAAGEVALVGTHDTPTFAGWLAGNDIGERVRYGLLKRSAVAAVRRERAAAVQRLAGFFGLRAGQRAELLVSVLEWLARSKSTLVLPWLEDLWLEETGVNLPGTRSSERPNWQRPMSRLLDELVGDREVREVLLAVTRARGGTSSRGGAETQRTRRKTISDPRPGFSS